MMTKEEFVEAVLSRLEEIEIMGGEETNERYSRGQEHAVGRGHDKGFSHC